MIEYTEGYKYWLHSDYSCKTDIRPPGPIITNFITLLEDGTLFIKKGYAWDGPSGPSYDTSSFMRGSLSHDAFYQLMRQGLLDPSNRKKVDILLRKNCLEDGMSAFRAWYVYVMVRKFAGFAASTKNKRVVLTAP